jgi:hypothetical protein
MKLSAVQSHHAALIAAEPTLAAFGAPLIFDPGTDDDVQRKAISDRLRATGVCFEIGSVEAEGDSTKPNPRFTVLDANFPVYIAENPKVAHALSGIALVEAVATALQKRVSAYEQNARVTSYAAALSEQGYVLHILTLSVPATL